MVTTNDIYLMSNPESFDQEEFGNRIKEKDEVEKIEKELEEINLTEKENKCTI